MVETELCLLSTRTNRKNGSYYGAARASHVGLVKPNILCLEQNRKFLVENFNAIIQPTLSLSLG